MTIDLRKHHLVYESTGRVKMDAKQVPIETVALPKYCKYQDHFYWMILDDYNSIQVSTNDDSISSYPVNVIIRLITEEGWNIEPITREEFIHVFDHANYKLREKIEP